MVRIGDEEGIERGHNLNIELISKTSEPPTLTPMSFGQDVVNEGDYGQLLCSVIRGDPPFSFQWSLHGDIVHTEPGLTTNQIGGRTSILTISSIGHRHSGQYTCTVSNNAGQTSESTQLKVNG